MNPTYPKGTTSRLLATDLVTPKTREVLGARIAAYEHPGAPEPGFFTSEEFRTLQAVCARLLPQSDRDRPIDLAGAIDQRLAASKTNSWRYDTMPPDGEAFRRALRGLDETARTMSNDAPDISFERLDASTQDVVLTAVQRGDAAGDVWETMPSTRWFEELGITRGLWRISSVWPGVPQIESVSGTPGWNGAARGCRIPQSTRRPDYACQCGSPVPYGDPVPS